MIPSRASVIMSTTVPTKRIRELKKQEKQRKRMERRKLKRARGTVHMAESLP